MRTSTKRILSIGASALILIFTVIVFINLIQPELSDISGKRALIISKESLFQNQSAAVNQVQDLVSQFQSANRIKETVNLAMPVGPNTTEAIHQIETLANQSQVRLKSFTTRNLAFEPTKQPLIKRLGKIEVAITVDGAYEAVKTFLKYIETNVRIINVQTYQFGPITTSFAQAQAPQELYSVSLTVEMYYQE